jgi:DNA-binding Lrp family transcriptional regulator
MRKQEMLVLSRRDRDRLKVLHEAERGHLTQQQAGERLKLRERWVRKRVARRRKEGDRGILHRLRGRACATRLHFSARIISASP